MSIIEFSGGPITYRYLERKSKSDLAHMYMDLLCINDRLHAKIKEFEQQDLARTLGIVAPPAAAVEPGEN